LQQETTWTDAELTVAATEALAPALPPTSQSVLPVLALLFRPADQRKPENGDGSGV
jgi:hypothetical protein